MMSSDIATFIKVLQKSKLDAECPKCRKEFSLAKALLFDGKSKFPDVAQKRRLELENSLKERIVKLTESYEKAKTRSEKGAVSVGIGKIIEKILPAHKNFTITSSDCRFLGEPIDMIVFDGVSENKIKHMTFLDVKTGNASLNSHQRLVRDAVEDHNVEWKVV